jgi:hypothetical protein
VSSEQVESAFVLCGAAPSMRQPLYVGDGRECTEPGSTWRACAAAVGGHYMVGRVGTRVEE